MKDLERDGSAGPFVDGGMDETHSALAERDCDF
jgi:hypothetical protein